MSCPRVKDSNLADTARRTSKLGIFGVSRMVPWNRTTDTAIFRAGKPGRPVQENGDAQLTGPWFMGMVNSTTAQNHIKVTGITSWN